jgi:hypothetical protein
MKGTRGVDAVEDAPVGRADDGGGAAAGCGTGWLREPKRWTRVQKKAAKEQATREGPAREQPDRPSRGASFDMAGLEDQFADLHRRQKGNDDFMGLDFGRSRTGKGSSGGGKKGLV